MHHYQSGTVTLDPKAVAELLMLAALVTRVPTLTGSDAGVALADALRRYLTPIQGTQAWGRALRQHTSAQRLTQGMSEAGRAAAAATPERRLCPFPDYEGNPIHEGGTLQHPTCGTRFTAVYAGLEEYPWRARYAEDGPEAPLLGLAFQVNHRGQAVVVKS